MAIKYTIQGLLVYMTIAAYVLAFVVTLLRRPKAGPAIYLLGFAVAIVSFGYRWYHVRHVPLQNLFEVFLCLGMIYPVSLFCKRVLRVGGYSAEMIVHHHAIVGASSPSNHEHAQPQIEPPS